MRKGDNGSVCASVEVQASAHGHPAVRQTITLYAGVRRIEFATRILKDATPLLDAHLAFPFDAARPAFRYEGVLAVMSPVADYLPGSQSDRVTVQNWVKVSDGGGNSGFNILWSALDAPVASLGALWPGYVSPAHRCVVTDDVKKHRRITVGDFSHGWIYSDVCYNNLGTNFSVSQNGELLFRYAVTSCKGETPAGYDTDAQAALFGWQAVTPLTTMLACPLPQARLPVGGRLLNLKGQGVTLLALKRAEDGRGLIARLWNMADTPVTASLGVSGMTIREACRTNVVEEDEPNTEPVTVDAEGRAQVSVGAHSLATVRLIMG
jgi:alpha-mannosidase